MRFLVTGANGLVGRRVVSVLSSRGHAVTSLGRGPQRSPGTGAYVTVDLADELALGSAVRLAEPEVIIHPGSMTDVDGCESASADALRVNGIAPGILAVAARDIGAHLVHVSTDYVFDGLNGPYAEDAIPNPRGVYAITKHVGELAVQATSPTAAIARTAVVYGWPPAGRANFGSWLLGALRKHEAVYLFEDQFVSPSLADSVAEQLVELGERRLGGIWNVCGASVVNRVQFGEALCKTFDLDASVIVSSKLADAKLKSPRPARSGLLTTKAAALLAAQPLGLVESLARFRSAVEESERRPG